MMAILHFTTLVITTLFAAGAAALVNSTYAPSHRGQSIDWPGGRDFAQSGARF